MPPVHLLDMYQQCAIGFWPAIFLSDQPDLKLCNVLRLVNLCIAASLLLQPPVHSSSACGIVWPTCSLADLIRIVGM